jgi:hypothetical protein
LQAKKKKKKSAPLFACCFAPSAVGDEDEEEDDRTADTEGAAAAGGRGGSGGKKKAPALGATKAGSFKMTDIGKVCMFMFMACMHEFASMDGVFMACVHMGFVQSELLSMIYMCACSPWTAFM